MPIDLQATYRSFSPPKEVDRFVRAKLDGLEQIYPDIVSCALTAEQTHSHQLKGMIYRVAIAVTVAGGAVIADRDHHNMHAHEDIFVAIEDAFEALKRALTINTMDKTAVR